MRIITRTVYGARLQALQYFGHPYTHINNTTLNEKFDIFPTVHPDNDEIPQNRYFVIGNRGHRHAIGADGQALVDAVQHQPSDAALYGHLPFIMRRATEDLTIGERVRYCLRKAVTYGGVNYIAYYGRRLDLEGINPVMQNNVMNAGINTITPFVPSGANLNPVPPVIPPTGTVVTSGDFLSVANEIGLVLDQQDIEEIVEAATIMYSDPRTAIISEIGLVAGVDKILTAPGGLNYNEVVDAQITAHITDFTALNVSNKAVSLLLDVGAVEPLLVTSPGP